VGYEFPDHLGDFMRHITQLTYRVLTGFSLAVFIGICTLWIRGHSKRDLITLTLADGRIAWIESVRNGIQVVHEANAAPTAYHWNRSVETPVDPLPARLHYGFGYFSGDVPIMFNGDDPRIVTMFVLAVPDAGIVAISAVLPSLWVARRCRHIVHSHRNSLRATQGLCMHCGYDLRASKGRCPECGRERNGK
jgi:hypothetical protein